MGGMRVAAVRWYGKRQKETRDNKQRFRTVRSLRVPAYSSDQKSSRWKSQLMFDLLHTPSETGKMAR